MRQKNFSKLPFSLIFAFAVAAISGFAAFSFSQEMGDAPLDLSVLGDDSTAESVATNESDLAAERSANAVPSASDAAAVGVRSGGTSFWKLVKAGGWIGVVLLLASIFAVSLAIRLCLALRRSTFSPPALETELAEKLAKGEVRGAFQTASEDGSFLGRVAAVGLRESDRGWAAVEKALEDAISEETAALYRKTEPLATVGNVAPMLGLLGTVVGMVATFGELAAADAGGRNLANGIYYALVTTVDGLIVAIPVLVVHSLLNGRVATLASETAAKIDRIFAPVKRRIAPTPVPTAVPTPISPARTTPPKTAPAPPTSRPTATPGLREVEPPQNAGRASLSLKPKRSDN